MVANYDWFRVLAMCSTNSSIPRLLLTHTHDNNDDPTAIYSKSYSSVTKTKQLINARKKTALLDFLIVYECHKIFRVLNIVNTVYMRISDELKRRSFIQSNANVSSAHPVMS